MPLSKNTHGNRARPPIGVLPFSTTEVPDGLLPPAPPDTLPAAINEPAQGEQLHDPNETAFLSSMRQAILQARLRRAARQEIEAQDNSSALTNNVRRIFTGQSTGSPDNPTRPNSRHQIKKTRKTVYNHVDRQNAIGHMHHLLESQPQITLGEIETEIIEREEELKREGVDPTHDALWRQLNVRFIQNSEGLFKTDPNSRSRLLSELNRRIGVFNASGENLTERGTPRIQQRLTKKEIRNLDRTERHVHHLQHEVHHIDDKISSRVGKSQNRLTKRQRKANDLRGRLANANDQTTEANLTTAQLATSEQINQDDYTAVTDDQLGRLYEEADTSGDSAAMLRLRQEIDSRLDAYDTRARESRIQQEELLSQDDSPERTPTMLEMLAILASQNSESNSYLSVLPELLQRLDDHEEHLADQFERIHGDLIDKLEQDLESSSLTNELVDRLNVSLGSFFATHYPEILRSIDDHGEYLADEFARTHMDLVSAVEKGTQTGTLTNDLLKQLVDSLNKFVESQHADKPDHKDPPFRPSVKVDGANRFRDPVSGEFLDEDDAKELIEIDTQHINYLDQKR